MFKKISLMIFIFCSIIFSLSYLKERGGVFKTEGSDEVLSVAYTTPEDINSDKKEIEIQTELFEKAMEELQALGPDKTAEVWIKGVEMKNGAMQYAVLCRALKEDLKRNIGGGIWITSPSKLTLTGYEMFDKEAVEPSKFKISIKANWSSKEGTNSQTVYVLTIGKEDCKWRILKIENKAYKDAA